MVERLIGKAKSGIWKKFDRESKTLFRNSSWVFFSNFAGIGLNIIRSIIIARGLGAKTFGSYVIVVAFVGIVQEFLNLNLGTAIIKFGAAYHNEQRIDKLVALVKLCLKVSGVMVLISIVTVVLLTILAYSTFVHKAGLEMYIMFYAVASGTKYFNSISNGILRLYFKFKLNSIIQITMDIVETVLVVTAVSLYPKNLDVFFITMIMACFLNGVICNWMAFWELRHEFRPYIRAGYDLVKNEIGEMKTFVIGNSLGNSLKSLMGQGDVLLLGILAGPSQVGIYSVAKKIGYAILAPTDPLMQSIFPQFSKLLAEKKFLETKKMLGKITLIATIPSVVFIIITFFLKEWMFVTIFGKEYLGAVYPFLFLLLSAVFSSVTFWSLPLIISLGLVKLRLKVYMIAIVVGATIAYFAVPQMHAAGMGLALLCVNLVINTIFIFRAYQEMKTTGPVIS
ncbi:MAG: oligosaccharide flippase family protein [Bacteroidetes bacterium]|nr:oligosaccharide flippase family protein [Bacteroidota bacterium]